MEGMRGCSRLSCIKSAIEYLVHREFHSHKRLACGVSHNLQEPTRKTRIDNDFNKERKRERTNRTINSRERKKQNV